MSLGLERSVKNSALWAAYGDALGFITELTDASGVKRRANSATVSTTVPWKRLIGGKFGANVELPAGAYSDDTQLRLATCRAIRSDGYFDVESFAKIELPVWLCYGLGGGLGTKSAANQLTGTDVAWFSNFFATKTSTYVNGGGNGAAMRVQPHVWTATGNASISPKIIADIIRNSVCTHGHMRGIVGAVFHGLMLFHALTTRKIPGPDEWPELVHQLLTIEQVIRSDRELGTFWLPIWEERSKTSIDAALRSVVGECFADLDEIVHVLDHNPAKAYELAITRIEGTKPEYRGSGTKTALLAGVLSWLFRNESSDAALITAVNELESDTDTIATMAGAILGAVSDQEPSGELQDREYIAAEASRLARIGSNSTEGSFEYPDVMNWRPPKISLNVVSRSGKGCVVSGLGLAEPTGSVWESRKHDGTCWQWLRIHFGQSILAKRRIDLPLLPLGKQNSQLVARMDDPREETDQARLFGDTRTVNVDEPRAPSASNPTSARPRSLDELTSEVIRSGFKEDLIGKHILELAGRENGIELAVAYVSIVAKAKRARAQAESKKTGIQSPR